MGSINDGASSGAPARKPRPAWLRVLIWVGVAFVLFNTVGVVLFLALGAMGGTVAGIPVPALILFGVLFAVFWSLGGSNLLRTWGNKATADFTRRDDPATGGHLYDVRPARASWLAVLVPLPLCAFVALWGVLAAWMFYVGVILYFVLVATFILPGARSRKPVQVAVSPQGLRSGDVGLPLARVDEITVDNNGVGISSEPLMPGPNGVPTSSMVGRGLGRRQVQRSYTVNVRGDGDSHATTIAGGLTAECAHNLAREISKSVQVFSHAGPA